MNKYLGKLLAGIFVFSLTIGQAFAAANPRIYVQVNDPLVSGRQWENEQNVEANDILDMLITVVNEGDSVANGVMVRDVVPAQTSYVLGSTKKWAIGDSDWVSIDDSGAFPFGSSGYSIGDMQPSAWVFYTYQVRANSPLPNTDGNAALEYAGAVLNYSDGRSANSIPPIIRSYPNYAFGENAGWISMKPQLAGSVFQVLNNQLSGYVWGENLGWVKLASDSFDPFSGQTINNYGVVNSNGVLSGYAWAENGGWLKFNSAEGQVQIDQNGYFIGYIWSEDLGWISAGELNIGSRTASRTTGNWKPDGIQILPQPEGRVTRDADEDCHIDGIIMKADALLNDDFSGLTILVDDYSISSIDTYGTANDDTFYLNLTEKESCDTGATPKVTIVSNSSLTRYNDSSDLLQSDGPHGVNATDRVSPVVVERYTADLDRNGILDAVRIIWSEDMNDLLMTGEQFSVRASAANGQTEHTVTGFTTGAAVNDEEIYVQYSEANEDTAQTSEVKYLGLDQDMAGYDMLGNKAKAEVNYFIAADGEAPFIVAVYEYNLLNNSVYDGGEPNVDDDIDELAMKWSEPINDASIDSTALQAQFTLAGTGADIAGLTLIANGSQHNNDFGAFGEVDPEGANDAWITVLTDDQTIDGTGLKPMTFVTGAGTFMSFGGNIVPANDQLVIAVYDRAAPVFDVDTLYALDLDNDGYLDHIRADLSEDVLDSSFAGYVDALTLGNVQTEWRVKRTGTTEYYENVRFDPTVLGDIVNDSIIYLAFDEKLDPDTNTLLDIVIGNENSLLDIGGNNQFITNIDTETWNGGVPKVDKAAPAIVSRLTRDIDTDGQIDRIILEFSEDLVGNRTAIGVNVSGYSVTGYLDGANAREIYIDLIESGLGDTGVLPVVQLVDPSDLADASGNAVLSEATGKEAIDFAGPAIISAKSVTANQVEVLLSESPLLGIDISDFVLTMNGVPRALSAISVLDNVVTLTASDPWIGGDQGYVLFENINVVSDSAGNGNEQFTAIPVIDAMKPALIGARTVDSNHNGHIDQIEFMFDKAMQNIGNTIGFSVSGYTIDASGMWSSSTSLLVGVAELTDYDTGATPSVSYDSTIGVLTDVSGKAVSTIAPGSMNAEDGAGPVPIWIVSTLPLVNGNVQDSTVLRMKFSENLVVNGGLVSTSDFVATGLGGDISSIWSSGSSIDFGYETVNNWLRIQFDGATNHGNWLSSSMMNLSPAAFASQPTAISDTAGNTAVASDQPRPIFGFASGLIITEFMANPEKVDDAYGEYIEIYNPTAAAVDINGWSIRNTDSDPKVINNGGPLLVPAFGYVVLGRNNNPALNGGVTVNYVYTGFALDNVIDEIVLLRGTTEVIDQVSYDSSWTIPSGKSLELRDISLDNNLFSSWGVATTPIGGVVGNDLGTPGYSNDDHIAPAIDLTTAKPSVDAVIPGVSSISVSYKEEAFGSGIGMVSLSVDGGAVSGTLSFATGAGAMSGTVTFRPVSALASGPHTVSVSVRDRAGNLGTGTWNFYVDNFTFSLGTNKVNLYYNGNYDATKPVNVSVSTWGVSYKIYAVMDSELMSSAVGYIPHITESSAWNTPNPDVAGFGQRRSDSVGDLIISPTPWTGYTNGVMKLIADFPARSAMSGRKSDVYNVDLRGLVNDEIIGRGPTRYEGSIRFVVVPEYL